MPPAAISRSSTYFPKICGNIAALYPSAFLAVPLILGCGQEPAPVTTVPITAHVLSGCRVEEGGRLLLTALGPFPMPVSDDVDPLRGGELEERSFPSETQGVEAVSSGNSLTILGYSDQRTAAGIDVLLWPGRRACPVTEADSAYPGDGGGQALGFSPETGIVLVAGEDALDGRSQSALRFDVNTGIATPLPAEQPLPVPLSYATITPFESGLLVAGGEDPTTVVDPEEEPNPNTRARSELAYFYDPAAGAFDAEAIRLVWDRSRHAALALANGATLLVGGLIEGGLVRQLEGVFPSTRAASIVGFAALDVGRLEPTAITLDDGRVLVGGGRQLSNGAPVGEIEWFSPDATAKLAQASLPQGQNRAFFALPGGGAVSVPGCAAGATCADWEASFITPDYEVVPFALPRGASCPVPERPLLVPGGGGVPLLVATYADAPPCVWRFNPWPGDYESEDDAAAAPRFVEDPLRFDPAPDSRARPLTIGAGVFVWVSSSGLYGTRIDSRGPLSHEAFSLTATEDTDLFRPKYLVPDRPLLVRAPDEQRPFERVRKLHLSEEDVTFWITDTRFGDATITIELATEDTDDPRRAPPIVRLGSSTLGDAACPWPEPEETSTPEDLVTVTITRRGASATLTNGGPTGTTCSVADGDVAIGLGLGDTPVDVRSLTVRRD